MSSKDEECTICLEPLNQKCEIGIIKDCCHYYHDHCILQWSSNSNSCPTCRKLFYYVELRKKDSSSMSKLVSITDKLLPNDAIDNIPREFVIPYNQSPGIFVPQTVSTDGICIICTSSDYRSSSRQMIACSCCGTNFHHDCLGITDQGDDITWYCPICDNRQLCESSTFNLERLARLAHMHTRVTTSGHQRRLLTRNSPSTESSTYLPRRRPGLIIHNENDELDDDFLYENNDISNDNRPIVNGGTILRRELKIQQSLSKDEAKSWDIFEEARRSSDEPASALNTGLTSSTNETKRRKRKRITPVEPSGSLSSSTGQSRISTFLNQIRNPATKKRLTLKKGYINSKPRDEILPPASFSPSESDSDTEFYSRGITPLLSLTQKMDIQKYIRDRLKPIYRPSSPIEDTMEPIIRTEETFININKRISRQVYEHITSLLQEDERKSLNNIFENKTILKEIVYTYLEKELESLKRP
ncbi:uncharacterized protein PRCAT00005721001 [Priceomyces carsonii]|uniref:uncharacterized protein n=1 Tax=Priceomyces carsonii TaxID=28549 RepID=UPI002ED981AD|nr:unnamed protein product [Priceomyces carsonii]